MNARTLKVARNALFALLVAAGLVMASVTYAFFQDFLDGQITTRLIVAVLLDFLLILGLSAIVFQQIPQRSARRASGVASPLRARLSAVFAVAALVPTAIVAGAGTLVFGVWLGEWLETEVQREMDAAYSAARSYYRQEQQEMADELTRLAGQMNAAYLENPEAEFGLRKDLQDIEDSLNLGLENVFVIDSDCAIIARGRNSYLFHFDPPPLGVLLAVDPEFGADPEIVRCDTTAEAGLWRNTNPYFVYEGELPGIVIYRISGNRELKGVARLESAHNRYLAATKPVSSQTLDLYDSIAARLGTSRETVRQLGNRIFVYSVGGLLGALLLLFVMVQFGIWYARRLSKPVAELASAAAKVGKGDFGVKLDIAGDDEIAELGRVFNKMVGEVQVQSSQLMEQSEQAQRRERTFLSVLSNVTPGVIGLDGRQVIVFMNRSAAAILAVDESRYNAGGGNYESVALGSVFPEVKELLAQLETTDDEVAQRQLLIERKGRNEELLVRCATRTDSAGMIEGFVVALDDITELVAAQRKAAWSEVAQRVAHEVKNPIMPIEMSVYQLDKRIGPLLDPEGRKSLRKYTRMISSNMQGLARITDEFSKFARMPDPDLSHCDLAALIDQAIDLELASGSGAEISAEIDERPLHARIDRHMILQVFTNLLKNAREAIAERRAAIGEEHKFAGRIVVSASRAGGELVASVMDNGCGFPEEKNDLLKPFMTKREGGTGLGLSNALRAVQNHGGRLELDDAPAFDGTGHRGAMVRVALPAAQDEPDGAGYAERE